MKILEFQTKGLPLIEMENIVRTYYYDFFRESTYSLEFTRFNLTKDEFESFTYAFKISDIEENDLILEGDQMYILWTLVTQNGTSTSSISTRVPIDDVTQKLIITDKNGNKHYADVFIKKQSNNLITLNVLRIYSEDFKLLFSNK